MEEEEEERRGGMNENDEGGVEGEMVRGRGRGRGRGRRESRVIHTSAMSAAWPPVSLSRQRIPGTCMAWNEMNGSVRQGSHVEWRA